MCHVNNVVTSWDTTRLPIVSYTPRVRERRSQEVSACTSQVKLGRLPEFKSNLLFFKFLNLERSLSLNIKQHIYCIVDSREWLARYGLLKRFKGHLKDYHWISFNHFSRLSLNLKVWPKGFDLEAYDIFYLWLQHCPVHVHTFTSSWQHCEKTKIPWSIQSFFYTL
jgi:hypothetical protein